MTHQILKSALAPPPVTFDQVKQAFGNLVDTFIHEMQTWHDHDVQVKALQPMRPEPKPSDHADAEDPASAFWRDFAAWQTEKRGRHEPYPAPLAHPDIAASIKAITGADGSVTYVPDFEIVNDDPTPAQIFAAKKALLLNAVHHAEQEALKQTQLPLGKRRLADLREVDIRGADPRTIGAADQQHLADQESRRAKVDAIVRAAAQVTSDIEDLTTDNVDTFTIPIFATAAPASAPGRPEAGAECVTGGAAP
ncbi:hypothetical protein [Bradyrhizobium uaiense]|uniref:Uncharacterized protein n=1 Tax=Bradyrhizobium uaiense TaxID=2594946 RepID=A0A6P1BB77_9BRAD|nr:hypothetical protein [Bradyrhizobium uaiense]NEU95667.1 hypothetical protein [Bradyrhizobium uaiense]